ncbi:hypothetical protein GBAR_LOCUS3142, partial [Geodia barretti]
MEEVVETEAILHICFRHLLQVCHNVGIELFMCCKITRHSVLSSSLDKKVSKFSHFP